MQKNEQNNCMSLDQEKITSALNEEQREVLKKCEVFDAIESTNDYLLSAPFDIKKLPRACFARQQSHGRGRRGRRWSSTSQHNIYMSVARLFKGPVQALSCFGLVVAIAVVRVLRRYQISALVKWPNDILVDEKKIAGILLESKIKPDNQVLLIIGTGLNVDMSGSGADIEQPWTDVMQQSSIKNKVSINALAGELLGEVLSLSSQFEARGFSGFVSEWRSVDICYQRDLTVYAGGEKVMGQGRGIDEKGFLRVEVEGEIRLFHEADVSVRVNKCY